MINGIQVKICGITSLVDAEAADRIGADYLGFILWPKSPRHIALHACRAMIEHLPFRKKVAVLVEPDADELRAAKAAGFNIAQIHFRHTTPIGQIAGWSHIMGPLHLWLAPKLPLETGVPEAWLPLADGILLDAFRPDAESFGGTGMTGDWEKFARYRAAYPENLWILAGGLTPDNVGEAVNKSGARFVDVNSGVEAAPGVKSAAKLEAFARGLKQR
jgi:phosphoribosylanthranilate isomerase